MEGLQRSAISFRRQGSSGFVWDDKFLSQELDIQLQQQEDLKQGFTSAKESDVTQDVEKIGQVEDPPSPRVASCCLCSVFERFPALPGKSKWDEPWFSMIIYKK